jgi:hypothetical protein
LTTGRLAALFAFRKRELSVKGEEGKPLVLVTENCGRLVQTRNQSEYRRKHTTRTAALSLRERGSECKLSASGRCEDGRGGHRFPGFLLTSPPPPAILKPITDPS